MICSCFAAVRSRAVGRARRDRRRFRSFIDPATLHRARTAAAGIVCLAISLSIAAIPARPQEVPTFAESAEVTAFDLVVGVEDGAKRPASPEPAAFELSVGGEAVAVDAVHPGVELTKHSLVGDDSWSILVWLAADLSSSYQLRWAAAALAQLTTELTAMGDVELMVGDPEPRRLLPATRDATALETALSRLAVEASGEDRLSTLRYDYVAERTAPTLDMEETELARAFVAEEERIVLAHQDALLLALDERTTSSHRRRLLLLVSGGFEAWPRSIYEASPAEGEDGDTLATETKAWSRSVAAYGWITVPVLAPALDHPVRGGFTLGKLRLFWGGPPGMPGVHGGFEEDRDPERAAAYVLLARSQRAEGRLEDAAEAFERALYHYYDDKKTMHEQGMAWLELGSVLSELGNGPAALAAWELGTRRLCNTEAGNTRGMARESCIPAALAQRVPSPALIARSSLDGERILQQVAATTGAFVVREGGLLREQLRSLAARPRISFQISGLEPGQLLPVGLSLAGKAQLLPHPQWVRSGSTERLASARLRHLLAEGPLEDDSGLLARSLADTPLVLLELPEALAPKETARPEMARLSWAWAQEDTVRIQHELLAPRPAGSHWQLDSTPIPPGAEAVVMVELLLSRAWGSAPFER